MIFCGVQLLCLDRPRLWISVDAQRQFFLPKATNLFMSHQLQTKKPVLKVKCFLWSKQLLSRRPAYKLETLWNIFALFFDSPMRFSEWVNHLYHSICFNFITVQYLCTDFVHWEQAPVYVFPCFLYLFVCFDPCPSLKLNFPRGCSPCGPESDTLKFSGMSN